MKERIACKNAIVGGRHLRDFEFVVENGRFESIGAAVNDSRAARKFDDDVVIVPGFINGHSHAYQILLRGWADDWSFERWRDEALYRVVPQLTPDDVYAVFRAAFREMLAAGITTVAEFFYLNASGNAHAEAAIAAARSVGIRMLLARTWMDSERSPAAFRETTTQAAERTAELMRAHPDVAICPAPHSLHAASPAMIAEAAEFARERSLPMHIHVAEAPYESERTLAEHGATPVRMLERLGALNERLVAVHAIYVAEDEKDAIAAAGARIVHNPLTNQYLGDGICDVAGYRRRSVTVGLGTDANVAPSIFDEMRAASYLQKVATRDPSCVSAHDAWQMGTSEGARALSCEGGDLQPGMPADYCVVDLAAADSWSRLENFLVYRAPAGAVRQTFVGGRSVYEREGGKPQRALAAIARKLGLPPG